MHKHQTAGITLGFVVLMLAALACTCGPLSQVQEAAATGQAAATQIGEVVDEATQFAPTLSAGMTSIAATGDAAGGAVGPELTAAVMTATALAVSGGDSGEFEQWAISATASSQYSDPGWSAMQAAGEPNVGACGDNSSAWASSSPSEVATLTLNYAVPVIPSQIVIYETYNPDAVTKIEVVSVTGDIYMVYEAFPQVFDDPADCPFVLEMTVSGVPVPINQVIITIDQVNHPGWNEIDAVQLVGVVE
jgi:hypothetical protein